MSDKDEISEVADEQQETQHLKISKQLLLITRNYYNKTSLLL